jgi:hypothetical protein
MKKKLSEKLSTHKGIPKSWATEAKNLESSIETQEAKAHEYLEIIDALAKLVEELQATRKEIKDGLST